MAPLEATPLCHNLPLNVGGAYDFLLANRREQRRWDVTFVIWLHKIVASLLLEDSLYYLLGLFDETSCHVGKAHMASN